MAIAFFSTWTTYGTWLPGDERGWFQSKRGWREPDPRRAFSAALRMTADVVILTEVQRKLVEAVIAEHCVFRGWEFHAVNCRTNHVHVVVSASDRSIGVPREQFKAWTNRRLKERAGVSESIGGPNAGGTCTSTTWKSWRRWWSTCSKGSEGGGWGNQLARPPVSPTRERGPLACADG